MRCNRVQCWAVGTAANGATESEMGVLRGHAMLGLRQQPMCPLDCSHEVAQWQHPTLSSSN